MELPRDARKPAPRGLLVLAGVAALITAVCILTIDKPVARTVAAYEPLVIWKHLIKVLEWITLIPVHPMMPSFVLGAGMLLTVLVKRWRHRAPAWMFAAGTHIASAFVVSHLKDLTGRLRPRDWIVTSGADSFGRGGIAFPSGHVSTFAGLALILAVLYPRHRVWLGAIILAVCAARVLVNAHWVSDATGAVAVVALVAWIVGQAVRPISPR